MYWPLENFKIQLQLMHKLIFFSLKSKKQLGGDGAREGLAMRSALLAQGRQSWSP